MASIGYRLGIRVIGAAVHNHAVVQKLDIPLLEAHVQVELRRCCHLADVIKRIGFFLGVGPFAAFFGKARIADRQVADHVIFGSGNERYPVGTVRARRMSTIFVSTFQVQAFFQNIVYVGTLFNDLVEDGKSARYAALAP